jgi:uncharacterized LabA/DUF88 family protein
MITKVAILIDGGFFWKRFVSQEKRDPTPKDVVDAVIDAMSKVAQKTDGDTKDVLFRIFYYDCDPFGGIIDDRTHTKKLDCSKSPIYLGKSKFLAELSKMDKFALRKGELSFAGWKQDLHNPQKWKPDFNQKGVDMKVGIDMASMAIKHVVDKMVLIAGDSDFVAPIKFVRREGVQVYLYRMGNKVKELLIEHCDFDLL